VSKIIGAPPGYVGHDESGSLTETVKHRPYSVILFDEIEKAHPEIFNILLQVLDNGRLTDSKGRTVNFRNTVIIMTSNIGAQYIDRMEKLGFSHASGNRDKENYLDAKNKIMSSLKDYFRPEFLNRVDDTIIFDILSPEAIKDIVKIQVDQVVKRLEEKQIHLALSAPVYDFLAKEGYNPQYGARPLKRLIQNKILTPVANLLISQEVIKGGTIEVGVKAGEFTFDVKKKQKGESPIVMPKMVGQK
jgi:ATP-dependent Clp protease ATP-binding subunit ClpC